VLAAARPDFVVSGEGKSAGINNDDRSIDGFVRILSAKTKGGADERRASQHRSETQEFGRTQALGSSLGIKPWDEVVSIKALVSQALSNLSDDQTDFAIASPSSAFSDWSWRMRFSTCPGRQGHVCGEPAVGVRSESPPRPDALFRTCELHSESPIKGGKRGF
jgi:hypothetical protein